MKLMKRACLVSVFLLLIGSYPQQAWASKFTGQDFLILTADQQKFWIIGAIHSLSGLVFLKDKEQGQCIYDWYFKDDARKHGLILVSAKRYAEHEPRAVLFALVKRDCGEF